MINILYFLLGRITIFWLQALGRNDIAFSMLWNHLLWVLSFILRFGLLPWLFHSLACVLDLITWRPVLHWFYLIYLIAFAAALLLQVFQWEFGLAVWLDLLSCCLNKVPVTGLSQWMVWVNPSVLVCLMLFFGFSCRVLSCQRAEDSYQAKGTAVCVGGAIGLSYGWISGKSLGGVLLGLSVTLQMTRWLMFGLSKYNILASVDLISILSWSRKSCLSLGRD